MSLSSRRTARGLATPLAVLTAGALLVGCTSNEPAGGDSEGGTEAIEGYLNIKFVTQAGL